MNKKKSQPPLHIQLFKMGKRSVKPGGMNHAQNWINAIQINSDHDILEIGPGAGTNTRMILANEPRRYCALHRKGHVPPGFNDRFLTRSNYSAVEGLAQKTGLNDNSFDILVTEAILSTHTNKQKMPIFKEANRVLRPGGIYAIHEIAVNSTSAKNLEEIVEAGLLPESPLTPKEWSEQLEAAGFDTISISNAPFQLFESHRIPEDEGFLGSLLIKLRTITNLESRKTLKTMRRITRRHKSLCGTTIIAKKR